MKKTFLSLLFFIPCLCTVQAKDDFTLPELCSGAYYGQGISGVNPLNDNVSYSQLSPDHKQILTYSFKTGEQTGVLFDVNAIRNRISIPHIDSYIMSPDEKNILVATDTKPIYRHSRTANYYIYNVANKTLAPLSEGGPQEVPVWSNDGYQVAFVREGNIFLVKLLFNNSESQVTKDGKFNEIINGKPDWVNEEEFANDRSLTFNADGTMLCWIRYDESNVPTYSFPRYKGQ